MIDITGETWMAVKKHCDEQILALQQQNEAAGTKEGPTENIRGQIAALRGVLEIAEKKPDIPPGAGSYT